ncbi:SRPBCC family protein [Pelatocladus sp. BLCC-F211]|uniref:SRPBCC family protein n=1 Tax=Pelatocladus sp. BLCC-F211 TaxID=3342752 RepID=UPI0035B7CB20
MSKTYDLNQKSDFPAVDDFKTEMESKTLNSATDPAILEAVKIKIEKLEGRQRRIFAKIQIPYQLEQVWQVLTDYEAFAKFMPNITQSQRLEHPTGGTCIEQVRSKSFMGMKFSAHSVFDVEEKFPYEIHYQLIEGDFKALSGYWQLEPWKSSDQKAGVDLIYNFLVVPKPIFPLALVEHILSHDVPLSLLAIRQRVEELFSQK